MIFESSSGIFYNRLASSLRLFFSPLHDSFLKLFSFLGLHLSNPFGICLLDLNFLFLRNNLFLLRFLRTLSVFLRLLSSCILFLLGLFPLSLIFGSLRRLLWRLILFFHLLWFRLLGFGWVKDQSAACFKVHLFLVQDFNHFKCFFHF